MAGKISRCYPRSTKLWHLVYLPRSQSGSAPNCWSRSQPSWLAKSSCWKYLSWHGKNYWNICLIATDKVLAYYLAVDWSQSILMVRLASVSLSAAVRDSSKAGRLPWLEHVGVGGQRDSSFSYRQKLCKFAKTILLLKAKFLVRGSSHIFGLIDDQGWSVVVDVGELDFQVNSVEFRGRSLFRVPGGNLYYNFQ